MRYVEVGSATGGTVRISAIGLGTWQFGSGEWGYGADYASREAPAIVERALDLGINLVDTAEAYGFGRSERIVGAALGARRDEAFIATKLLPILPIAPVTEQRARASAERLGVSAIDLYQVHWPNPLVPISMQMEGLRRLLDAGVVRFGGVSNFGATGWAAADRALGAPLLSNQVRYSLVHRAPERAVLGFAQANDRIVIAYSPLGQGVLSGRYGIDRAPTGRARRVNPVFLPENLAAVEPLLAALREIGAAHGATPAQVALAWLIRRPNVVAIPGASSVAQLEANAAAAELELTDDEDARLDGASDAYEPVTGPAAAVPMVRHLLRRS